MDGVGGITTFSAVDSLRGYLGDDTFYGGDGGDRFFTERGNDTVYGGDGFDRVRYDRGGVESMDIDLAANIATGIWSGESFVDRLYDVESIRGSYVADEIRGSAADERLEGSGGSDVVDGRFGGDLSIGGADGDLILMGGADADSADGDRDVASGRLSSLNGDTVEQVGAEDAIFVVDAALTDAQVRLVGASLQIDGDGDGAFETVTTVRGPAIADAVPMLTYTDAVVGREWDEVVSGTYISFAPAAPTPSVAIGEVVQLTAATSWQTLSFANGYIDPVAFALAASLNEVEAVATRFRDVTGTGAQIRLQETKLIIDAATGEPVPNTGGHVDETVTLLVLERGIHTLEDGTVIEIGELVTEKLYVEGFETTGFEADFASAPTILSQVQTFDGADFIISRQRTPTADGFELTMQEEQADNRTHFPETVGWLAAEHGGGSLSTMDWQG